jgi:hypothetical protein
MKRYKNRQERLRQQGLERLKQKIDAGNLYDSSEIQINPEGEVKMSEVLRDFVEPYVETTENQTQYENMLSLAIISWNLSFLPKDRQQEIIANIYETTNDAETAEFYEHFIYTMIQRKQAYFSEYTRQIVDFEVTDVGSEYRVAVASTLSFQEQENQT